MMGSSSTLLVFLLLLGFGRHSVLADDQENNVNDEYDDFLASLSDPKELADPIRSIDDTNKEKEKDPIDLCIGNVISVTSADEEIPVDDCITECSIEFLIDYDAGPMLNLTPEQADKCKLSPTEASSELEARFTLEKKWRRLRRFGRWWKKNRGKVVKGLQNAGRIIKGLIVIIGKKSK